MKMLSYIRTVVIEFGKGFSVFFLGAFIFIAHKALPNATADVAILYQGVGITLVVIGLIDTTTAIWRIEKNEKEKKRQDEEMQWRRSIQGSLNDLHTVVAEIRQTAALSRQEAAIETSQLPVREVVVETIAGDGRLDGQSVSAFDDA